LAFRGFKYYCSEAFKSIWYNKLMAITSIVTVMGCLILFGFFMVLGLNIYHITGQVEDQCEVQVFFPMTATEEQEKAAFENVKKVAGIQEISFETRQQAFENYKEMLGDKAIALNDLDPAQFLPASCRIVPADVSQVSALCEELKKCEGVDEVVTHMDTIEGIVSATSFIRNGCIISTILLAIISVFIITNTIKLDIHARQKEIHIMKYVGATDWFIRWPFIIEGIFVGILGAAIALIVLGSTVTYIITATAPYFQTFTLMSTSVLLPILIIVLALFGSLIGALGSVIAVRKHLKV